MEIDSHKDDLSLKEPHTLQQSKMKVNIIKKVDPSKQHISSGNKSSVSGEVRDDRVVSSCIESSPNRYQNISYDCLQLDEYDKTNKTRAISNENTGEKPADQAELLERHESLPFEKEESVSDSNKLHEISFLDDIAKTNKSTVDYDVNKQLPLNDTAKKKKSTIDNDVNERPPLDDTTKKNISTIYNNVDEKSKRGEMLVDFKLLPNPQDSRNMTTTTERRCVKKLLTGKFEFKGINSILTVVKTSADFFMISSSVQKDSPNSVNDGKSIEITDQSNRISETKDSEHSSSIQKTIKDSKVNTRVIKTVKDSKASRVISKIMNKQSDSFVKSVKNSVQNRAIVKPPIIPVSNSISQRQRISIQPGSGESVLGSKGDNSDGSPKTDDSKTNKERAQFSDLSEAIYFSSRKFDTWTRRRKSKTTIQSEQVRRGTINTYCRGSSGSLRSVEDIISIETDLSDVTLGCSTGPIVFKTSMRIGNLVLPDTICFKKSKRWRLQIFRKKFWARSKEKMFFRK